MNRTENTPTNGTNALSGETETYAMDTSSPTASPKAGNAIQAGLYIGILSVLISAIKYIIDDISIVQSYGASMTINVFSFAGFLLALGACIYMGKQYGQTQPDFTYGKAYSYAFQALFISGLINLLFIILLVHVVSSDLAERSIAISEEKIYASVQSEEHVEEAVEAAIQATRFFMSPIGLLIAGTFTGVIWASFLSLFAALGMRKSIRTP